MRQLAVVVLAAGEGTRMKSSVPKVLHEIAGLPMIGHVLATAHSMSANHVIVVLRHDREKIESYVSQHFPASEIAVQDEVPGTGRAAEIALELLPENFDGDVLVLSGDVPLIDVQSISELVERHRESGSVATLVSCELSNPTGYGRILRSRGELVGIVEQKDATDEQKAITEVNSGVYVFDAKHLKSALAKVTTNNASHEKYLTDVVSMLIEKGTVLAFQILDRWLVAGINDRVQLSEVAAELNSRIVIAWQLAGVTVDEPASTWIDITVQLGQDVRILPSTRLHGITTIGVASVIGPDTTLQDCQIGSSTKITRSAADSVRVADGASVGPFAFLRPGTELGSDGKIGAFVETKNAKIGPGAKVPHLSYVGDAEIGEGANIGAGTIFANYDGVEKHQTKVGKHARTGSGNVFVAPVSIGDGAYTAAGSTIRRDVEAGSLALNPVTQKNLADWVLQKRPGSSSAKVAKKETE
jgi:bifunctional UDP-N-acetylglucosamine pyrophosphorylase / glucosamine-1-phosphate N-acetyltransferase